MPPIVHERLRCPRCGARGPRELNRLAEETHAVFMCPFCKHTWCEEGRGVTAQEPPPAPRR